MKRPNPFDDDDDQPLLPPPASKVLTTKKRNPFEDDSEEEVVKPVKGSKVAGIKNSSKVDGNNIEDQEEEDDDVDPLDAFMAGIKEQPPTASIASSSNQPQIHHKRDDFEEEDHVESYINHLKAKGITVGAGKKSRNDEDYDSDEEVYATARAIDAEADAAGGGGGFIDEDDDHDGGGVKIMKGVILPLPPINHDAISYPEFTKSFYEEHPDIAQLTAEQVADIRREFSMHVSGREPIPKPCISFAHFGFEESLISAIATQNYSTPTGIQRQALPAALSGRDVIGIAQTGSGKTAAFIWPMLVHIMDQDYLVDRDGPIGLILSPTRELANQIYLETKRFAKVFNINVSLVVGGDSKTTQFKELRHGLPEIVIATPGRFIDMIKMKATSFNRCSFLVLDEADRMFDLGFEPQVRSICNSIRPDRQTLLFSATFPRKIESLARDALTDPIRIVVGAAIGAANMDVTQSTYLIPGGDEGKWPWLMSHLVPISVQGSTIIFVNKKQGVDALADNLKRHGFPLVAALHGDMHQQTRDAAVRDFKTGKAKILVCTDVAARGLDIKHVVSVINFDAARDIDSHVHRIGRSGRAGKKGFSYTLLTPKEDKQAGDLVRCMQDAGQPIPQEIMDLAMQNKWFRKQRGIGNRGGFGSRGRGRGGGRGGRGGIGSGANLAPVNNGGGGGGISRHQAIPSMRPLAASTATASSLLTSSRQQQTPGFISFQKALSSTASSTSFVKKQ